MMGRLPGYRASMGLTTLLLLACGREDVRLPIVSEASIYTRNKEFVYLVSRFDKSQIVPVDTVVLTSTGSIWDLDSTQTIIGWGKRGSIKGSSGVAEGAAGVWIHPPRFNQYAILELSPFPEVKKPFVKGQEWDWSLDVGSQWANPAWAVWTGDILVKSHYKVLGEQVINTPLGRLTCQRVTAVARCSQGSSTLNLLFHPLYGFVELDYSTIDGKRLKFDLLSAGVTNQFDGSEYFGQNDGGFGNN
jgi:hypothetical protein